ncbi:MAG: proteinral secretion pathway protein [Geobacteraceae bacterium]|nr:MAG: proteinral secretion pathway protein [Geobacteraceae bacterium]
MQLIGKTTLLICMLTLLAGCAGSLSAFNKAEKMEREGNYDEAVLKYAEAAAANPDVGEYRMRFLKASEAAAKVHLKKGDDFLAEKKYDDALREYQTAFALDTSLDRARQQSDLVIRLRNSLFYFQEGEALEKDRKPREALHSYRKALEFNPDNKEAKEAVDRLVKSRRTKLDGAELNLKSTKPVTLKFKDAKIKEIFNILSQLSGINFIFDEGLKDQNVSIYLENATFQQALDILTGINKLGKKVLNESTIIIYPKNPEKTKQYEELFVQTFYLSKLDAKKAVNLIRTMLQVKKIYVNEENNALVIRDTPDVIEVARKILEANDVPDAEVLLEVEVIELSKNNKEAFGLALSQYSVSLNTLTPQGSFFSPSFTTTTPKDSTAATAANLLQVFSKKGFSGFMTVPSATYNFGKTLANGETLASPKIRVKNREKAKFNFGTRVPITTTSSPTGGGVSVNVQYVDVGTKVNAEPTIQLNNEVTIKLSLEVSSILQRETVGGTDSATTVVTIGTRNLDTVLSLKDGETSIIGGLIQDLKTKSKSKIFLLGDIPLIGSLLSSNDNSNDKTELVLAITPRIVRGITVPELDVAAFWSGKEDEPSSAKPYSSFIQEPELVQPPSSTPPSEPGVSAAPPAAAVPSAPAAPSTGAPPPSQAPPAAGTPQAQAPVPVPPPQQPISRALVNITAPKSVKVNDQFTVEIKASDVSNLYNAPFILVYDPIFLDFVGAAEGSFLKQDGKPTSFRTTVDKNTGQVTIALNRVGDVGGVSGAGTLLTATLKARNKGPASFGFMGVNFTDPAGKPLDAVPYNAVVEVQ